MQNGGSEPNKALDFRYTIVLCGLHFLLPVFYSSWKTVSL